MVGLPARTPKSDSGKINSCRKRLLDMSDFRYFFYILVLSLQVSFFACNDDFENYSTNPRDLLSFSTDTLSFDTVLTTINSPVQLFKVYNRNSKPLLISSVSLAEGENSNFKINVDGFAGSSFENIEILAKDSLYVLVDVKPAANGNTTPTLFNDQVVFVTNNVSQKVVLEAYGQDAYKWKGMVLTSNSILSNQKPFLIYDSLVIKEGITLEIKEGTTFYMHNNAQLIVKGTLKIRGSQKKPVIFRGYRTDYLSWIPFDVIPGQWDGIRFTSKSYKNEFENVRIYNGKFGMYFEESDPSQDKIKLKNVVLTNVSGTLIKAVNCKITAENCEFSNAKDVILNLIGGIYRFTHCTIANYYPSVSAETGWGKTGNETLILTDTYYPETEDDLPAEPQYFPVISADFYNTILTGGMSTSGIYYDDNPETFIFVHFHNCLIQNEGYNDEDFVDCIFHEDPLFMKTDPFKNERQIFIPSFDFRLQKESPLRNAADPEISGQLPYDLNGVERLVDGKSDIGAYEYSEEEENK
jgi:hypothetical protein